MWSAASGECLRTIEGHASSVDSAVFSADGQQVLTTSDDGTAKVWSAASGECLRTLEGHASSVDSTVFSPDGQQLLTASDDKTAKVWSAASGVCLLTLEGHKGSVHSDRIPRGAREGAPVHLERPHRLCEFFSVLSLRLTILFFF